jgi:AraC-like DNA-binding protein
MEIATHYRQYYPTALLAECIECYWVFRSPSHAPSPFRQERLIPGGRVEMIFNFGAPLHWLISSDTPDGIRISNTHFMGQRDRIYYGRYAGATDMLGIRFKTGGLTTLAAPPISSLLNKMIPAEDILGPIVKEWEARLYEQANDTARINLLDHLLLNQMAKKTPAQPAAQQAIDFIRSNENPTPIAAFCEQAGWSYKRLERLFLKEVGYTPKAWHRLIRFNKALRQMTTAKDESLTSICYECGYYDQSHFIKDFSRYAGTTPGRFQAEDHSIASLLIRHQPV